MLSDKKIASLIPPEADRCLGFMVFMFNAELDPKKSDEDNIKDLGIVAARKCIRCKYNNQELPCTINETPSERGKRHAKIIAKQYIDTNM